MAKRAEPAKTLEFTPFIERLNAFAESYCSKRPSLAMIGEMAWVLGVEIDFKLVPCEPDAETPTLDHPAPPRAEKEEENEGG